MVTGMNDNDSNEGKRTCKTVIHVNNDNEGKRKRKSVNMKR
jgi:hypothetical protein